ncbi:hypothetical protein U1Q18_044244 [Sarracenia purpurea var. burkii]
MLGSLMEVEGELADGADGKGMPQECTGCCDVGLTALSGSKQKKEMNMAWEMFGLPKDVGFVCLFEDKVGGGANDDLL